MVYTEKNKGNMVAWQQNKQNLLQLFSVSVEKQVVAAAVKVTKYLPPGRKLYTTTENSFS